MTDLQGTSIQETVKSLGVVKFLDLGLAETLSKLAPHGIQHHFGEGAQTGIVFDLVVLQLGPPVLIVLANVLLAFGFVVTHPGRPPAGFLLDFQPGVDVLSEEPFTGVIKMPHLVDVLDLVSQLHRFVQFGGAPRAGQGTLLVGVGAPLRSLVRRFDHFVFDTSSTEWKDEFTRMAVRQHGMVQFTRREDAALDESKVEGDDGVTRLGDEARMSFGVHAGLVDLRVQGGDIDVMDLLTRSHTMVQFEGIRTTPTEGVTWVERFREFKAIHERLDVRRGLFEAGPLTFPHFNDIVP